MANTKSTSKTNTKVETKEIEAQETTDNIQLQMMEMMKQMQSQLAALSTELNSTKAELASTKAELEAKNEATETVITTGYVAPVDNTVLPPVYESTSQSLAEKYIETLASRKSDKEVTIVHNREIVGGGTTHIQLSTVSIDFRRMGESRVLSWNQFEECASKYAGFFKREVILVADKDREVAEIYKLPCVKRSDGEVLTREMLEKMGGMSASQLTTLYNSLTKNDKQFMLSYWLGQCYNRVPGFYDRHKIETLNTLSETGAFDTFIAFLNGEALNAGRTNSSSDTEHRINGGRPNFIGKV